MRLRFSSATLAVILTASTSSSNTSPLFTAEAFTLSVPNTAAAGAASKIPSSKVFKTKRSVSSLLSSPVSNPYSSYYGNPSSSSSSSSQQNNNGDDDRFSFGPPSSMTRQAVEREPEPPSSSSFYSTSPTTTTSSSSTSSSRTSSPRRERGESPPPTFEAYFQERQRQQQMEQQQQQAAQGATTTTTISSNSHFPRSPIPTTTTTTTTTASTTNNSIPSSSPASKNVGKTYRVMEREIIGPHSVPSYMSDINTMPSQQQQQDKFPPSSTSPPPEVVVTRTQPPQAPPSYMMMNNDTTYSSSSSRSTGPPPYAAAMQEEEEEQQQQGLPTMPLSSSHSNGSTPPSPLDMYKNGPPRRVGATNEYPNTSWNNLGMSSSSASLSSSAALEERLDVLVRQQSDFLDRLDRVESKLLNQDQVEDLKRTEQLLHDFRKQTQLENERFLKTVTDDIHAMKTTLDKVLVDQQALKEAQEQAKVKLQSSIQSQQTLQEKLVTLEKTQSIRMTNIEQSQRDAVLKQTQAMDQWKQDQQTHQTDVLDKWTASLKADTQDKFETLQQAQIDRMNALEELQQERLQQGLEKALQDFQQQQQQQRQPPPTMPLQQEERSSSMNHHHQQHHRYHDEQHGHNGIDDQEDDDDDGEEELELRRPAPRGMLRDRLMQQGGRGGGEQMYYKQSGNPMKQDPVKPPQPMGPVPTKRNKNRNGNVGSGTFPENEFYHDDDETDHDTVQALNKYRSHPGDEPLPNNPFGTKGTVGMGRFQGPVDTQPAMPRRDTPPPPPPMGENRNAGPPPFPQRRSDEGPSVPPSPTTTSSRGGAPRPTPTPPNTPMIDRKLQHFLQETIDNGPKDHFDKEMEALLLEKYTPMYPWLKTSNAQFIRSVLTTFLEHKGAQVEMDLRDASEQAAYEWDELMTILKMELRRITGAEPRIEAEGNNQWGIYSSNTNNHNSSNNNSRMKERKRNLNNKAFVVSDGGMP